MKQNLMDITFIIPIRLDSIIRLENLLQTIQHIHKHFITNIIVLEAAEYNNGFIKKIVGGNIDYCFVEDRDPVFYRTKYLNQLTDMTKTPYIAIWDADIIIPKEQILYAIKRIRENIVDVIYPYDGHFYDISIPIRELFIKTNKINILSKNVLKMDLPYGNPMIGGAFMANKDIYMKAGKENEDFYGWGPEDGERYFRWRNLGIRVEHGIGNLYHLSHPRGINSEFRSERQKDYTLNKMKEIQQSSKDEILQHLST